MAPVALPIAQAVNRGAFVSFKEAIVDRPPQSRVSLSPQAPDLALQTLAVPVGVAVPSAADRKGRRRARRPLPFFYFPQNSTGIPTVARINAQAAVHQVLQLARQTRWNREVTGDYLHLQLRLRRGLERTLPCTRFNND